MNELDTEREYKHFLCYDQRSFEGIEYGFTDLFFDFNQTTMFIKEVDHRNKEEKELQFPLKSEAANIIAELKNFLITIMSDRYNFVGTPVFVQSRIFSEATFDEMLKQGIILMDEKYDLAIKLNSENELIKYCKSIGLNPEPEGSSPTNWEANCLSGGQHRLMISTKSNEWGCGYCKRKGDINSLREWYESKKKAV
jgi:hypothetical protein